MNRRMREGEVGEREKGRKGERERESEGVKANGRGQVFLSDSPHGGIYGAAQGGEND